ncbi:RagB/SusD family nutrient uptake outer membrane protein [Pedobacter sp. KBW06]|uniref:RagB/SusD family nutrient uptake outer membrane protein n=1 Tax=Pedobacter sp. KBW06 TaxID=2153359 RepID=UPI000F5AC832|nr:RagB/SusD family nutrient uptake outer membrane protein [Pedobacter sp. KBW06]RQO68088.1 RagB/SusD family nutrient uptake outer membrane protein [Pedobacter sp. KBW06]
MKRILFTAIILTAGSITFSGCKKYLNVTPIDNLSGNNYWQNQKDVEAFTTGIYNQFRENTLSSPYFATTGDLRCSPAIETPGLGRSYITAITTNSLSFLINSTGYYQDIFNYKSLTQWSNWYKMVQAANILYVQADKVEVLSVEQRKKYRAEAVFLRNLAYFFMVRQFGDIPYYTKAYNQAALPRMKMVEVLNNCIADMKAVKDDLPWTYEDPSIVGIRAMRGSAIALMMHMNMWAAGFTEGDKAGYYTAVDELGKEIMSTNSYELLPITRTKEIFKGRTKESLFEVLRSLNYGEYSTGNYLYNTFTDMVLHYPHKPVKSITKSYIYYNSKFMAKLYPSGTPDKRGEYWFDPATIYATDGRWELLKFVNIFAAEGEDVLPDDDLIVFRLPDAILLRAEAQAELGNEDGAKASLNLIRARAVATPVTESGKELKDAIFYERCRELMGEGHYYYDLVRTKKVLDKEYCFNPISVEAFKAGAWAWPIDKSALIDNPYMVLNSYWK